MILGRARLAVLAIAFALVALGPATARADKEKDDDRPSERLQGLKFRVFEVKHRPPGDLMRALRPLASGVKGTTISDSNETRTITVRDFPENVAAIEEALKRLDVAAAPKPNVDFKLRVLVATPSGPGQYPSELESVIRQLRATLNYKSYYQVTAISQRVKADGSGWGNGNTQISPPVSNEPTSAGYKFAMEDVNLLTPTGGPGPLIQVRKLRFFFWSDKKQLGEAEISTSLTLREGEKVVVGTASLKERAMIVVLSAQLVK